MRFKRRSPRFMCEREGKRKRIAPDVGLYECAAAEPSPDIELNHAVPYPSVAAGARTD